MDQHLTRQQEDMFRTGKAAISDFPQLSLHLAQCVKCRERVFTGSDWQVSLPVLRNTLLGYDEEVSSEAQADCFTANQLANYLSHTLSQDEANSLEEHLAWCPECKTSLDEVRLIQRDLSLKLNYEPPVKVRWWDWEVLFAQQFQVRNAIVVLALIGLFCFGYWKYRTPLSEKTSVLETNDKASELSIENNKSNKPSFSSGISTPPASSSGVVMNGESGAGQGDNADKVSPSSSHEAFVELTILDGNRQVQLDVDGKLHGLDEISQENKQAITQMLLSKTIHLPKELAQLLPPNGELLGDKAQKERFQLLQPVGKVVTASRPVFHWQALEGAEYYQVSVFDCYLKPLASSERLHITKWKLPISLDIEGVYLWQVVAMKEGKEVVSPTLGQPEAKFFVLGREYVQQLEQLKRSPNTSHLLLASIYAQYGMRDEARKELQQLLALNLQSSPQTQQVLNQLLRHLNSQ